MQRRVVVVLGVEDEESAEVSVDLTRISAPPKSVPRGVLFGVSVPSSSLSSDVLHFATVSCASCKLGLWLTNTRSSNSSAADTGSDCGLTLLLWDRRNEDFTLMCDEDGAFQTILGQLRSGARVCEANGDQSAVTWHSLASRVDTATLERVGIPCGTLVLPGNASDSETPAGAVTVAAPPNASKAKVPKWTALSLPHDRIAGMSATERTRSGHDSSERLEWVVGRIGLEGIIAEFQLAFVVFTMLSSMVALDQWKAITSLVCSCSDAVRRFPGFFAEFLDVSAAQLECCDMTGLLNDPLVASVPGESFAERCYGALFETLSDPSVVGGSSPLAAASRSFRQTVIRTCGFDPTEVVAFGEDAPAIVDEEEESVPRSRVSASRHRKGRPQPETERHRELKSALDSASVRAGKETRKPRPKQGPLSFSLDD